MSCFYFDIGSSAMPPKKPAVDSADLPEPSSNDAPVEKKVEKKSGLCAHDLNIDLNRDRYD